jgi:hypothetical protein
MTGRRGAAGEVVGSKMALPDPEVASLRRASWSAGSVCLSAAGPGAAESNRVHHSAATGARPGGSSTV